MPATKPQRLASWDASKQQQYRKMYPQQVMTFHILLDASPSMIGQEEKDLRKAYNMYLAWLQQHANPMSLMQVQCFSSQLVPGVPIPLGTVQPLTPDTYNPRNGDGTALYWAIGDTCTMPMGEGQHVLIVFTDGMDNQSEQYGWTCTKVGELLTTLQEHGHWLCVFLGAYADALHVARMLGFTPGNCLEFGTDKIADAFQTLQHATQRYLAASLHERKLLAAGGIF